MQFAHSARRSNAHSSGPGAIPGHTVTLAAAWNGALQALTKYMDRQEALAQLYSMDDLTLNDVGISRGQIPHAVQHGRS